MLKMLVRDATTGRIGTYQAPVEVRNVERETDGLPISTVVLGSQQVAPGEALYSVQQRVSTDAVNPLVVDGRQWLPSVTRVLSRAGSLYVLLHAYQTRSIRPQPVIAYAALYRAQRRVRETPPVIAGADAGKEPSIPVAFSLALDGLEPGEYECQVTVLSPQSNRATFWRAPVTIVR